jgi:FKBP-type peptidyl-prolyl cis-trans isomerase
MRALWVVAVLSFAACKKEKPAAVALPPVKHQSGLVTQVLAAGDGDEAKHGDKVQVHYVGTLLDGTVFDSSRERSPFAFWVGEGQVIQGWDEGVLGMREGEVRKLTVPPELGYGSEKKGNIPPQSTLVFEIELLDVR